MEMDDDYLIYEEVIDVFAQMEAQKNPMEIHLIVKCIMGHLDQRDAGAFRVVNSTWNDCGTRLLQRRNSMTLKVQFKSRHDLQDYNDVFRNNVFHDSFSFEYKAYLNFKGQVFNDFVELVGDSTKYLDLSHHSIRALWFPSLIHQPNIISTSKLTLELLEKILFQDFPHLVKLRFNDIYYNQVADHFNQNGQGRLVSLKEMGFGRFFKPNPWGNVIVLSEELMKISPNLVKVKVSSFHAADEMNDGVIQRTLKAISQFAPRVFHVVFESQRILAISIPEPNVAADYANLKIKRLEFREPIVILNDRLKFFENFTPLKDTVEEFTLKSNDALFGLFTFPPGFKKMKILKIKHRTVPAVMVIHNFFQLLNQESPLLEELTVTTIPSMSDLTTQPFANLKILHFKDVVFDWNSPAQFEPFYVFVHSVMPKLEKMKISLLYETHERESQVVGFPFLVWMANKLPLKSFAILTGPKGKQKEWTKDSKEKLFGLETFNDLNDRQGNFTMENVKTFDFSSLIREQSFTARAGNIDFVKFLIRTLPRLFELLPRKFAPGLKLLNQDIQQEMDDSDEEDEEAQEDELAPEAEDEAQEADNDDAGNNELEPNNPEDGFMNAEVNLNDFLADIFPLQPFNDDSDSDVDQEDQDFLIKFDASVEILNHLYVH